ncbi:MAG: response regulator [Candidatus Nealsonbacteria bacterium]|nr:response regulator [Candidatus Nealsonbacteria bacterium]
MTRDRPDLGIQLHIPQTGSAASTPRHVLLAEDDDDMRALLVRAFLREGYHVTECLHGVDLLVHLESFLCPQDISPEQWEDFDLIVSDIRMPGVTALEVIEGIQQYGGLPPIILITAFGDRDTHMRACELGTAAVFDKPFEFDDLLAKALELVPPQQPSKE